MYRPVVQGTDPLDPLPCMGPPTMATTPSVLVRGEFTYPIPSPAKGTYQSGNSACATVLVGPQGQQWEMENFEYPPDIALTLTKVWNKALSYPSVLLRWWVLTPGAAAGRLHLRSGP